ncbi:MAG: hypothetical protein WCI06_01845 [Methylococcaceae bacterium]
MLKAIGIGAVLALGFVIYNGKHDGESIFGAIVVGGMVGSWVRHWMVRELGI